MLLILGLLERDDIFSKHTLLVDRPLYELEQRPCLECGVRFQPARDWLQFNSTLCRSACSKRTRKGQARLRVEANERKVLAATTCDAMATVK